MAGREKAIETKISMTGKTKSAKTQKSATSYQYNRFTELKHIQQIFAMFDKRFLPPPFFSSKMKSFSTRSL